MKKAFDQTVRDIKRGVNKKVLKVPSIEQKVLDATSNESWGPHGSLLADIAQASRNYHEYQMIISIIWKRINDTGKNWRHVYKGLTVLEYLVANGSERVIDEIREHAFQISALSGFQYIDSSGRDQGTNVRKKSQSIVALVNDKERIQEVREKAAANWDKFHNTSGGGKYRPGGGYDENRNEGRYGSRDEEHNGYGRDKEWGDDKYGRYGDPYGRDGDRYGEERYSRDGYRDDEFRGRRSVDGDNNGRRSRSSDRDKERAYEDDGHYSSRGSNAKADDQSHDGRQLERKSSEQNLGGPPSYEDAIGDGVDRERDGGTNSSSPPVTTSHETTVSIRPAALAAAPQPVAVTLPPPAATMLSPPASATNNENDRFDEFDPRSSYPAVPPVSGGAEVDLFGSLSDALALVPSTAETTTFTNPNPAFVAASSAPAGSTQPFEDPFGDGPFRAVVSTDGFSAQPQSTSAFDQSTEPLPPAAANGFGFGGSFDQNTDILADLLPPTSQTGFQVQPAVQPSFEGGQPPSQPGFPPQEGQFMPLHGGQNMPFSGFPSQTAAASQPGFPGSNGQPAHLSNFYGGFPAQVPPVSQQPQVAVNASTGALAIVPQKEAKFETKSTVWADTLNRGLVNLNISGSKTNPLSDIGIDFEALNRREKRMEKPSMVPATSNVMMGKAMGSGSGIGRAGAGAIRPQPNPMVGSAMGAAPAFGGVNKPMQYPQAGFPPGSAMSGTYHPMMGDGGGGYGQQPYGGGGGYR